MRIGLTFQLCKNAETHVRPCFCLLEASLFLPVGSVTDAVHTIRLEHSLLLPYCFNQGQAQQCIKHTHEAGGMQHGMRVYILCMSPSLCYRRHVHSSCHFTLRGIWLWFQVCMYTCATQSKEIVIHEPLTSNVPSSSLCGCEA